jgi:hypothetical protein
MKISKDALKNIIKEELAQVGQPTPAVSNRDDTSYLQQDPKTLRLMLAEISKKCGELHQYAQGKIYREELLQKIAEIDAITRKRFQANK